MYSRIATMRFGLRGLLVFVSIMAVSICFVVKWSDVLRLQHASTKLEALGGAIEFKHQFEEHEFNPALPPPGPVGLRAVIGDDWFVEPQHVSLFMTNATDADLTVLEGVGQIKAMSLGYTNITDKGLALVSKLSSLEALGVEATSITDDGLIFLCALTGLQELDISYTDVSDKGITYLKRIGTLKYLGLNGTLATESGVRALQEALPNCEIEYSPLDPNSPRRRNRQAP